MYCHDALQTPAFGSFQTARRSAHRHALAAERAGFAAHEQSRTEILLARVAAGSGMDVRVFTQPEEGRTGADWLWWFESDGEWFGVLVQAKRNKPEKGRAHYDFNYKGENQVDQLIEAASLIDVPAIYVLYNHPTLARSETPELPLCGLSGEESIHTRMSVAVLSASIAQRLTKPHVADAPKYSLPLECLTCSRLCVSPSSVSPASLQEAGSVGVETGGSGNLARHVARVLLAQLRAADAGFDTDEVDRLSFEGERSVRSASEIAGDSISQGLRASAPREVSALREGGRLRAARRTVPRPCWDRGYHGTVVEVPRSHGRVGLGIVPHWRFRSEWAVAAVVAVPAFRVVTGFDPVKDRGGELVPCCLLVLVEELSF